MKSKFNRVSVILALLLALAGCNLALTPVPTPTPTVTLTPSATPDVYATSAARTLAAIAGAGTESVETLVAMQGTATARASFTPSVTPLPATNTPTPTGTPTATVTLTFTPLPTGGTLPPTPQNSELIRAFTATPTEIDPGDTITLNWSTSGERVTMYTIQPGGSLGDMVDNLPASGSRSVTTSSTVRNVVIYALYVTRGDKTESATVTIAVRCPDRWFFPNPPDLGSGACPQSSAVVTAAAAERFEGGMMIWLGSLARIYVLFNDTTVYTTAYSVFSDPWQPGMPESDPSIVPPPGLYQPVRGFGMIWRGVVSSSTPIRERLGWAREPEVGYEAAFQCDSAPKYNTCFVRGPSGEIIVLKPEGSGWYVWQGVPSSP